METSIVELRGYEKLCCRKSFGVIDIVCFSISRIVHLIGLALRNWNNKLLLYICTNIILLVVTVLLMVSGNVKWHRTEIS